MKVNFSGTVLYMNGVPVPNVVVRILDKDAQGKQDDDLTVTPGQSDDQGHFTVSYEPMRFLDYHPLGTSSTPSQPFNPPAAGQGLQLPDLGDVYLPYLQFNYTFNGTPRSYSASLGIFQTEFRLPENPPVQFLPSHDGFEFYNRFSGYFLPFSTPGFLAPKKVPSDYGLCGGMSSAAYDYILAGRRIPPGSDVPSQGSRLQRYLYRRQMDSLGPLGQAVVKVAQWTTLPDDTLLGTQRRTADEFAQICSRLDDQNLVVLALVYEHAGTLGELSKVIFNNHQVLAYAYQQDASGAVTIKIYDPNLPGRDDVVIQGQPVMLGQVTTPTGPQTVMGLKAVQMLGGNFYQAVRGFFPMPYVPIQPPAGV
jgi:hypothetical protein